MRARLVCRLGLGCSVVVGLLVVATAVEVAADEPKIRFVMVVAKNSVLTDMTFQDLKHLYSGDFITGPGGKRLMPLNRALGSPERVAFDRVVTGMSPPDVASYWLDRRIRGQSGSPRGIESAAILQRLVIKFDGAIGYVLPSEISSDVKIVRIDGKGPADPGYPIER